MNEALYGALQLPDVLHGLAGLFLLWLLHRLSAHHPMQMARRAQRAITGRMGVVLQLEFEVVMDNLRQLLDENTWGHRDMSSWRKKAVDAWLDELVDHALAARLEVSDGMARFAEARRCFHQALRDSKDRPMLPRAVRRLAQASEALAVDIDAARAERPGVPVSLLPVLA